MTAISEQRGVGVDSVSVFSRIVVGVDGTEPGYEAARQVAILADPGAAVEAVAVVHLADAVHTGAFAPVVADELQRDAEQALDAAIAILGSRAERRLVNGFVVPALCAEVARTQATLLGLGSHGHHRLTEILIGGPAGELLHNAPCSVLLARAPAGAERFPRAIVVGNDGSRGAEAAMRAARHLAARLGSSLEVLTAVDDHPVAALVAASREADLLVVGSRGLHGLHALGSVSERVAHEAACSVLVVRPDSQT